jgi:hypothetical protein
MANVKEKMIKKLGTPVSIIYNDGTVKDSKSLISKAGYFNNSMIAVESHRKCDFVVTDNVTSGCTIINNVTNERYLTVALFPASYKDKFLSTVYRALVLNSALTITRDVQVADDNGNVTTQSPAILSNLPVYTVTVSQDLRQYNVGLHEDAEYLIYAPNIGLDPLDRLYVVGCLSTIVPTNSQYKVDILVTGENLVDNVVSWNNTYEIGASSIDVYLNGVYQSTDTYVEYSTSSIQFNEGYLSVGDIVSIRKSGSASIFVPDGMDANNVLILKAISVDNISFPGVSIIQAKTETRV